MRNENWTLSLDASELPVYFKKGTSLFMTYTWGYDTEGEMTAPTDVGVMFDEDVNIVTGIEMLMNEYASTVHTPRFYYVEAICAAPGIGYELHWGS